jgi:hypothetical protein
LETPAPPWHQVQVRFPSPERAEAGSISAHFSEFETIIGFDVDNRKNINLCVLHSRMF